MKRILIVIATEFVEYGGLTSVMLNYYRNINNVDYLIDFASTNICSDKLEIELKKRGSKYFCLGNRKKVISYMYNLYEVLKNGEYSIIHVNGNSSTMIFEMIPSILCHIKKRIVHVHTIKSNYSYLNVILNPFFKLTYTDAIAVSNKSGDWLYGKGNYKIFNNAIDLKKYQYNEDVRKELRKKLGLESKYVIGNVGKFNSPKNHEYLIDVFYKIKKKKNNAFLLIIGDGPLFEVLQKKCESLNIMNDVKFTGMVTNVNEYYQAMDVFVFPSLYEGFGLVTVEAQSSGLTVICSTNVPKETQLTNNIKYISLNDSQENWIKEILADDKNVDNRQDVSKQAIIDITKKGYNIKNEATKLDQFYCDCFKLIEKG